MSDKINKAVEVLNKHRWRERDDWRVRTDYDHLKNAIASYAYSKPGNERPIPLEDVDAIAIASWLELREAVEPFIKVAQQIGGAPTVKQLFCVDAELGEAK